MRFSSFCSFLPQKKLLFFIFLLVCSLIPPVSFLIVSAGFLMLSADAIRESADILIVSALKKAGWGALSLSCEDLWPLWKEKSEKIVDVFKPPPPPP